MNFECEILMWTKYETEEKVWSDNIIKINNKIQWPINSRWESNVKYQNEYTARF